MSRGGRLPLHKLVSRLSVPFFENEKVALYQWVNFAELDTLPCSSEGITIGVVCGGTMRISINGKGYKLQTNSMFVIYSTTNISAMKCSKACCGYMVQFKRRYLSEISVDANDYFAADMVARTNPVYKLPDESALHLHQIAIKLAIISNDYQIAFREGLVNSLAGAFFYMTLAEISACGKLSEADKDRVSGSDGIMSRFADLLRDHHAVERGVGFYAEKLGITPKYLSIVCRKKVGKTASRVIDEVVIHNAKMLLKQPGVSVHEVSVKLNFPSQSFFGKYFKQRVGISPSRYKGQA